MGKHATKIETLASKIAKMILLQLSLKSAKIIWPSKLSKWISGKWKSKYWGFDSRLNKQNKKKLRC